MSVKEMRLFHSRVFIGSGKEQLMNYLPGGKRVILVTERKLLVLYADFLSSFEVITIEGGEEHKTWNTVETIIRALMEKEADRETFIVAFGGGIVCDVVGFAASIYMRGCSFGFVPTTLLAQVDASVGGKNGINFQGYKNMIGVFRQPEFVLCDPTFLTTLGERDYVSGLAEVVKAAVIGDAALFSYLEGHVEEILRRESVCLTRLVGDAVQVKIRIVQADEREGGVRRLLNLGHTLAHAIEKQQVGLHGEAVSVGLCWVACIAVRLGILADADYQRLVALLKDLHLPTRVDIPLNALQKAIRRDKKRTGGGIHLILPREIGVCEDRIVSLQQLNEWLQECDTLQ